MRVAHTAVLLQFLRRGLSQQAVFRMFRAVVALCLVALAISPAKAVRVLLQNGECTADYNPVCGFDGIDYTNTCEAAREGQDWKCVGKCSCPEPLLTKDSTSTFCKTDTEATLIILGSGSGSAKSTSFCKAEADAQDEIREFVSNYIDSVVDDPENGCTVNSASLVAEATARAASKVITSVSTQVNIDGTGEACGFGFAEGDAVATALVDITVRIYLELVEEKYGKEVFDKVSKEISSSEGKAVGRAVAAVMSSAWAKATQGVCSTNGFAAGADEGFAEAIREATAFLWAEVVLTLCETIGEDTKELKEWRMELSESDSQVSGEVTFKDVVTKSSGDALAAGSEVPPCTGAKETICCAASATKDTCRCGVSCNLSIVTEAGTGAKVWQDDANGDKCFCP